MFLDFQGDNKMGSTDVPAIFPLLPQPNFRKAPMKHQPLSNPDERKRCTTPTATALVDTAVEEVNDERFNMQRQINRLTKNLEQMRDEKFGLQRFAGNDKDIRFYTGLPNYNTLTSFYEFLGPAVTQLTYWVSYFSEDRLSVIEKWGPSRKLKYIDELFLVLYRLHCNILEKDLADRFGIHPSSIS